MAQSRFNSATANREAERLETLAAGTASPILRDDYLRLARQWREFADNQDSKRTRPHPPLRPGARPAVK
ncbi:MAG TPA: hypothetical protein VG407_08195 [Caulobacteraceae bacterium]|jgi:hypothetical protein|nr:hypothetical protein [Caulobacteraceae bacterium]